jgi:hypothetical protein
MHGYLGETVVDAKDTPFAEYTSSDWALHYILKYGGIDGAHHKTWVLDQVARILHGAKITVRIAKWESGLQEHRHSVGTCKEYEEWVEESLERDGDGEPKYDYDVGRAP